MQPNQWFLILAHAFHDMSVTTYRQVALRLTNDPRGQRRGDCARLLELSGRCHSPVAVGSPKLVTHMNIAMKLPPSFSFRPSCGFVVILSLMNGACSSQGTEFERDPVIKRFIAGPVEFRFYASPATDGGSATNFKVGESIFLVSTVANFTGEEQICEPDYSKIYLPS